MTYAIAAARTLTIIAGLTIGLTRFKYAASALLTMLRGIAATRRLVLFSVTSVATVVLRRYLQESPKKYAAARRRSTCTPRPASGRSEIITPLTTSAFHRVGVCVPQRHSNGAPAEGASSPASWRYYEAGVSERCCFPWQKSMINLQPLPIKLTSLKRIRRRRPDPVSSSVAQALAVPSLLERAPAAPPARHPPRSDISGRAQIALSKRNTAREDDRIAWVATGKWAPGSSGRLGPRTGPPHPTSGVPSPAMPSVYIADAFFSAPPLTLFCVPPWSAGKSLERDTGVRCGAFFPLVHSAFLGRAEVPAGFVPLVRHDVVQG
ncbi:hypothetical protein DFH09DRAFT_1422857 [Mycena vulgaris]|nr:hypothetical protein DFH09DRAFT_1422857 [Mycena vulgaris]